MDQEILKFIKKTQYFSNDNIKIISIEKIKEETYLINTTNKQYEFSLYDLDHHLDLYSEINYNRLIDVGSYPKHTYEIGIIDQINKTYSIREYREEINLCDYLKTTNNTYDLGIKFANILRNIHSIDNAKDIDWYQVFKTKANYLFYLHGVAEVGDTDYILIDYIKDHKHLTKNLKSSYLYQNLDCDHIYITDNGHINLEGLGFNIIGDPIFDFTQVNKISLYDKNFAKGIMDGYFNHDKIPLSFYRLLSLYQAYEILDSIVSYRRDQNSKLSKDEISGLFAMYDNFNQNKPDWI